VPLLLLVLFIVVPIAELAIIIQIGQLIGAWWTIALLIVDSVLGSMLMRSQGRAAWRRFSTALESGRAPAREVGDGTLIIFGGALLLTPGFISDFFGLLLLLPPSRALIRRLFLRQVMSRITVSLAGARMPGPPPGGTGDVDGTAVEIDRDRLGR